MEQDRDLASAEVGTENRPEVDPFDPLALEERLRDARARRERVIAMRRSQRQAEPQPRTPPESPAGPARPKAPRRRRGLLVVAIFVAGAGLGAAAASLTSGSPLRQALSLIPPLSGEAANGGPAAFAAFAEPPALGAIGSSALSPIVAGPSDAIRPDLPTPRKIAALDEPELLETSGFAPAAWTVASIAAPPRPIMSPALPAIGIDADLAAGVLSRPEASRASVPPPVVSGAPATTIPLAGSSRVHLNVPVSVPEEIATAALDTLRAAALGEVFLASVSIPISRTNVRYYHDADAAHAGRISALLGPGSDDGGVEARDFTGYDPKPEPGTIEVWFAGDAPPESRRVQVATRAPSPVRATVAAPASGTGLLDAARASLAGLLGSRDGPSASASTRGAGGPPAIARSAAGPRVTTAAGPSTGGSTSAPASAKPASGTAATPSGAASTRSTPAAPASRAASTPDADASPSRRSAEPAVTKSANGTASADKSGKAGKTSNARGNSKAEASGNDRSAGRGKSASKDGGKDKGGKGSKAGKSASKSDGKGKSGKSSGGGKSGSKGGGSGKGGKGSGGKKK